MNGFPARRACTVLAVVAGLMLAACGAKEELIEPSPLPRIAAEGKVDLQRRWSADTGRGTQAPGLRLEPGITAQAVYTADPEGRLAARQRGDGKALWRTNTGYAFSAGPAAAYGQLVAGTREGELVAFSATDGRELWKTQLGGEVLAPPVIDSDAVLVKTTDGRLSLLERATGTLRWSWDGVAPTLALRASSRPLLLDDAALVGLPGGLLVAIDRAAGQEIWQRRIAEPTGKSELDRLVDVAGDFLIAGERLFAASYQGKIVAMDLRSGQFLWQQNFSTHQALAQAGDSIFGVDADGRVVAWRAGDGVTLWRQEALLGRGLTGCAVLGKYLLAGDADGWVHVLRQDDGVVVGRRRVDGDGIASTPGVDEGTAFVLGRGGKLAALTLE